MNILIIESDEKTAAMERDFLEGAGYTPFVATMGEEALAIMDREVIDAIVLDVVLPGEDGFSLCRKLRERTDVPILFATARNEDADIVRGLGLGADNYLSKPFRGTVLAAHVKALLSMRQRLLDKSFGLLNPEQGMVIDEMTIRPKARQVIYYDREVPLTGREFDLLYFLATHPNEVFSKEQLFEKIWSFDPLGEPATVTVHINRLREKLKRASGRPYDKIETIWGSGYKFRLE